MDIDDTTAPNSTQLNAIDLIDGPRVVTIEGVEVVGGQQPVRVHLREYPGRPYYPNKGMRRFLVALWGKKSVEYAGRRLELWRNPDVLWQGKKAGGIQISAASHIGGPKELPLTISQAKRETVTVKPLPDAPPQYAEPVPVPAFETVDEARDYYVHRQKAGASPDELAAIQAAAPKEEQ